MGRSVLLTSVADASFKRQSHLLYGRDEDPEHGDRSLGQQYRLGDGLDSAFKGPADLVADLTDHRKAGIGWSLAVGAVDRRDG